MRLYAHAFGGESASSRIHQPILPQTVQLCAQAAAGKYSPVAREVVACSHRPYAVVVSSPPTVCVDIIGCVGEMLYRPSPALPLPHGNSEGLCTFYSSTIGVVTSCSEQR